MSSRYVVHGVLPKVRRHLPENRAIEGVTVTPGGLQLPVSFGLLHRRGYYVAWRDREPAVFYSPARWRRMLRRGVAWIVADETRADTCAVDPTATAEIPVGEVPA